MRKDHQRYTPNKNLVWEGDTCNRSVQFSIRDRTGPRTGSDRTGLVLFGPVFDLGFCQIRSSVWSRVGPDQWTEFGQYFSFFCPDWRWHDRACWHGLPVPWNLRGHGRAFWHGQTVPNAQDKTGPDWSDPRSTPSPDFDLRSRPVRSWTDAQA